MNTIVKDNFGEPFSFDGCAARIEADGQLVIYRPETSDLVVDAYEPEEWSSVEIVRSELRSGSRQ